MTPDEDTLGGARRQQRDPITLRYLFAWVTILAALMGIWSLANSVVDESLREAEQPRASHR